MANIDAAEDDKENFIHKDKTAVNANELKNEKASNMPIPKNWFIMIFVWIAINKHRKPREIWDIFIINCEVTLSERYPPKSAAKIPPYRATDL